MSDYESLTYAELKRTCKEFKLDTSGNRETLMERLNEFRDTQGAEEEPADVVEENDDDDDDDDDDDGDGEEEADEEETGVEDGNHEIIGCLVRRVKSSDEADNEDADGEEEEVVFIGADAMKEAYEDALGEALLAVAQENPNAAAALGLEDDATEDESDLEDDGLLPSGALSRLTYKHNWNLSRFVNSVFLGLEALVVLGVLLGLFAPAKDNAETAFAEVLSALWQHSSSLSFWCALGVYLGAYVAVPTLFGLFIGRYNSAESVFGFALTRFVIQYLMGDLVPALLQSTLIVKLCNVTAAVSLITAFWDHSQGF